MDEKNIPANCPGEEEWEAFANDDDLANKPAPNCRLLFYTLEKKKTILHKAYSQPSDV